MTAETPSKFEMHSVSPIWLKSGLASTYESGLLADAVADTPRHQHQLVMDGNRGAFKRP
jgi:hypothetical protein